MLILITIGLGLFSRKVAYPYLPDLVNQYLGDAIWAGMIFLIFRFIFIKKETRLIALYSLAFCLIIELSQFYHAPWIDSVRATRLGSLILGFGYLWTDLLAYYIGVHFAATIELFLIKPVTYTKKLA